MGVECELILTSVERLVQTARVFGKELCVHNERDEGVSARRAMSQTERAATDQAADSVQACYVAGMEALARGDYVAAREWVGRCDAAGGEGGDARCLALRGAIAVEEGEFDEAISQLKRAVGMALTDTSLRRQLGEALAASGDLRGAAATLDEAAQLAPDDVAVLVDLAHVRQMLGDASGAREAIEHAAEVQSADAIIQLALARIYESNGELELAAASFDVVAQALPTAPVLLDLARLNLRLGRYGEAEAAFKQLAALDPDRDLVAQHGRIWCRIKRRDWRGALEFALFVAKADRFDLTTALLAYAKDRLFTRVSDADAAAREADLEARFLAELQDQAELYSADLVGAGEDGERG
jgi:tetratricopeptide (TPR) repeat protein